MKQHIVFFGAWLLSKIGPLITLLLSGRFTEKSATVLTTTTEQKSPRTFQQKEEMSEIPSRHGARIIFKRDSESKVGRGAVMYRAHFRPEMALILYWASYYAPEELQNNEMWVTEAWRSIRDSRDLHKECRAFDIDCTRIQSESFKNKQDIARMWAMCLSEELGPDYEVILHGGRDGLHLHVELDP